MRFIGTRGAGVLAVSSSTVSERRRGMLLYQNVPILAGSTPDDLTACGDDLEDVEGSSEEPETTAASVMAPEDGSTADHAMPVLGPIPSPDRRGVEAIDAVELTRLLAEQCGTSLATVVVDCRPYLAYSASHIVGAHNVCFPSLLERRRIRRQSGSGGRVPAIPLENIVRCGEIRQAIVEGRCGRVVVYDEETDFVHWPADVDRSCRISPVSQLISVLRGLADFTSCELHFLRGLLSQTCLIQYWNFQFFSLCEIVVYQ